MQSSSSSSRANHRGSIAAALCCSVISYAQFCKAFNIIQPHARTCQKHHPPFRLLNDRSDLCRMRLSMVAEGKYESSDPNNDDFSTELSDTGDWETMDIDEFLSLYGDDDFVDIDDSEELLEEFDKETLLEILGLEDDGETITLPEDDDETELEQFAEWNQLVSTQSIDQGIDKGIEDLEKALLVGVVPADALVGSGVLPGDDGWDPLDLSTKDYFKQVQSFILSLVPERKYRIGEDEVPEQEPEAGAAMPTFGFVGEEERPPALILRDYREAEIRHGRLAMLAAVIWPLQEIADRIFIPESFGSMTIIYGGPTLPVAPLLMTFFMLNLGYLDIYSSEIKENESGDAFLPGECFWDPLAIMEGAPDSMKRNMQEREILNGRASMIAVAAYIFEEGMSHKPVISLAANDLLFEPFFLVPFVQAWLDTQFGSVSYIDPGI
mmetsp:Transcript_25766/g.51634  ORF Transcript_25766/g.51634 Transcript_25766/m.51634 type:complete len:438 (+) Transcript_25766:58-1371(+)